MSLFEARKRLLNNLYSVVTSSISSTQALCVSVNAGWGFGKTFFMNELSSKLKEDKQIVISFNAWENDISDDAFIAFTDSLISGLRPLIDDEQFLTKANSVIEAFGKVAIRMLFERVSVLDIISKLIADTKEEIATTKEEEAGYFYNGISKTRLETVKEKVNDSLDYFFANCKEEWKGKTVFIIVDELDRCRPDFAIQVLERLKHLFSNPKLCFIFAINNFQLQQSIVSSFGDIDYSAYIEKFFDFSFDLPEPDVDEFLKTDIAFHGNDSQKIYFELLRNMIHYAGTIGLRQVERIFNYFSIICKLIEDFDSFSKAPYLIPLAVFAKVLDNDFFNDALHGNLSNYFNGKYAKYRHNVYNRIVFSENSNPDSYLELLLNVHDEEIQYRRCLGAFISDDERYYKISNSDFIHVANRKDLIKVFDLVASLS